MKADMRPLFELFPQGFQEIVAAAICFGRLMEEYGVCDVLRGARRLLTSFVEVPSSSEPRLTGFFTTLGPASALESLLRFFS